MDQNFNNPNIIDISTIPYAITFSFYSNREIHDLSIVEIFCPIFFDKNNFPVVGGLCDSRMGVNSKKENCILCKETYVSCPGHFGNINFAMPIINPFLKNLFLKIIKAKCWYCNFFKIKNWKTKLFYVKFLLLDIRAKYNHKNFNPVKLIQFTKTNIQINFQCLKIESEKIFKNWEFENYPKIKPIEKTKRGKFWYYSLNFFFKLCYQENFCQKCKKWKIVSKRFLNEFEFTNKKFYLNKKNLTFYREFNFFGEKKIFELCSENNSKIIKEKISWLKLKTFQFKQQIDKLWLYEKDFCELIWGSLGTSRKFQKKNNAYIFFLSSLLIPPTRFRPVYFSKLKEKNSVMETNPQNYYFIKALKLNHQLLLLMGSNNVYLNQILGFRFFFDLEKNISNLFGNFSYFSKKNKTIPSGIKQQLEQKFGLFRMYLMGKRVFHSARSVIVPDPFLESFEIGIPLTISKNLTAFSPINGINYKNFLLCKKPKNLNKKHNNCRILLESLFGKKYFLQTFSKIFFSIKYFKILDKKKKLISNKCKNYGINTFKQILKKKDWVLLNRQPSLHRASLMSHSIKIVKKIKCIKVHYSNCNAYNADFDGDEMNVHFPQNEISKSESLLLSAAYMHGKIPTHKTTMRGLIQDNIIAVVSLTQKNTFLNESVFFQLISYGIDKRKNSKLIFYPTILKPKILWTGKQVISGLFKIFFFKRWLITLESRTKLTKLFFGKDETKILIRKGELIRGMLDSSQIGKTKYGLIHAFNELYGGYFVDKFLSCFCKILIFFQRYQGFSSGFDDLILKEKIDENRLNFLKKEKIISKIVLRKILSKNGIFLKIYFKKKIYFDQNLKIIGFLCNQKFLFEFFFKNLKNILITISSNVIENVILGGLEKKFLSNSFLQMTTTGAKGSTLNIFQICSSLGQTELEGEIIACGYGGKTLPHFLPFDFCFEANGFIFQRFSTGILQTEFFFHCMAGREGLLDTSIKTSQSGYIQRSLIKHLESIKINQDLTVRFSDNSISQFVYSKNGTNSLAFDFDFFLPWFSQNFQKRVKKKKKFFFKKKYNLIKNFFFKNKIFFLGINDLKKIETIVFQQYFLRKHRFSFWEIFLEEKKIIHLYKLNITEPGEPVGIIAAQSLGEPCTQMTLNTFHFAGKLVSKNNFGIPRLREILLIASKYPKNPTMSGFFKKNVSSKIFFSIEKRLKPIFFLDLIETLQLFEERKKNFYFFNFRFRILHKKFYKHILGIKKSNVIEQIKIFWKKIILWFNTDPDFKLKLKKIKKNYFFKNNFFFQGKIIKNLVKKLDLKNYKNFKNSTNFIEIKIYILEKIDLIILGNKSIGFDKFVRNIQFIKTGFIDYKEKTIHIEGVNFYFLWKNNDIIDSNKIFSNDIYSILLTYGIEAAREVLIREIIMIFEIQTIFVNIHHLDLISDYMTRLGNFRPFGRKGIAEENLFQKMTYETAIDFLINSSLNQDIDFLSSVSGAISLGKICNLGTGNFEILFSG